MKRAIFPIILAALAMASCGNSNETTGESNQYVEIENLPGDSTLYGLACEGCTDSLLVVMPFSGGDPDTLDILMARVERKVFGRPTIGDRLAVMLNAYDPTVADMVINIDALQQSWHYMVEPRLRRRTQHPDSAARSVAPSALPDSLRRKWLQPREYGLELRRNNMVMHTGIDRRKEQQGPVEYPTLKRYRRWHLFNGRLVLSQTQRDTSDIQQTISSDTADIMLLRRDTLVLRFADKTQGFYCKP